MNVEYVAFFFFRLFGLSPLSIEFIRCANHSKVRWHLVHHISVTAKIWNCILVTSVIFITAQIIYSFQPKTLSGTMKISNLIYTVSQLIAVVIILNPFSSRYKTLARVLNESRIARNIFEIS